ncbi:Uncharacterised protein [Mycobacteroides abscessus subsp. abscessus]|uniref:hypothetical protein n=1 Tax=Mycobacteroides abscessus TaxID=36809 RepID=UPI0009A5BB46|nr:hypothetical protein [Mycobacteroides abscessus]SKF51106.1 Uncharacterised protein [Mycobacteroides abscessus subsp. abscessus]
MTPPLGCPGPEWLDANAIAARTGGIRQPNTVRSWWAKAEGGLAFEIFPGLSTKSNKRSHRDVVDTYLHGLGITPHISAAEHRVARSSPNSGADVVGQPRLADVLDALLSVKAAADAALDAVISEAEGAAQQAQIAADHVAQQAQAAADQAAVRLETYKKLRTMMHGYDMALSVLIHPDAPPPGL